MLYKVNALNKNSALNVVNFNAGSMLLINKPLSWTSFDVVNKVRNALKPHYGKIKVGHAGTLDPLADGLMIVLTGKYTRKMDSFLTLDKSYSGIFWLGKTSPTYDAEGELTEQVSLPDFTQQDIEAALLDFRGNIQQKPPIFSALKKNGQTAYSLARQGKEVELDSREIQIHNFQIPKIDLPKLKFEVHCSKGTYIRSLAHDLGVRLGCGAYLYSLTRTSIGEYNLNEAWDLPALIEFINKHTPAVDHENL